VSAENLFANSSPEMVDRLSALLRKESEERMARDPSGWFPWHRIQTWILDSPALVDKPVRVILVAGGNRGGKTKVGMGMYSQVIRRESPINDQLLMQDPLTGQIRVKGPRDPLNIWVAPPTLEKARLDWLNPSDQMGLFYWQGDRHVHFRQSPDTVLFSRPPGYTENEIGKGPEAHLGLCDKTVMKSQDQSVLSFESSAVDMCIFDEEVQDVKKWNSVLLRLATNNGVVLMSYTPLHGLTWSYDRYWAPLVAGGRAEMIEDRCWIHEPTKGSVIICAQFGSADNPMAAAYAEEIEGDPGMTDAEKSARLHGEYGYVEGSLVPALSGLDVLSPRPDHAVYVVDHLPGQQRDGEKLPGQIFQYFLVTDPNKSYGGILGGLDAQGNVYLIAEHLEQDWPDRRHLEAFREMERRFAKGPVRRIADPGSAGAHSIINMADLGMVFEAVRKEAGSVGEGVKQIRSMSWIDPNHKHPITGKMGAPRLYFYRPGMVTEYEENGARFRACRTAQQISAARQTDNVDAPPDTPHKSSRSKLDLFDCVRYLCTEASKTPVPSFLKKGSLPQPGNVLRAATITGEDRPQKGYDFTPQTYDWE
jgi:hypothetical protein